MRKLLITLLLICTITDISAEEFIQDLNIHWKDSTPFLNPSLRFLDRDSYSKINSTLKNQGIHLKHKNFYDTVIDQEELGYMGYHASSHEFRVFQDIIKIVLEEVLDLEIPRDFYFLRVPTDPYINHHPNAQDFLNTYSSINDNLPEQRNQILSVNYTIFSNYDMKYECSAVFFEKAISFKPPNFESKIGHLFDALEMPLDRISDLFNIGQMVKNNQAGVLFQLFDFSHQTPSHKNIYELLDGHTYPSIKKGEPIYTNKVQSDLFQSTFSSHFLRQYRLILNNDNTLNPYSSLHMRRYTFTDPAIEKDYEIKLRQAIRKIPFNRKAAQALKKQLQGNWQVD